MKVEVIDELKMCIRFGLKDFYVLAAQAGHQNVLVSFIKM